MLNLKSRDLPMVKTRAILPEWLGPGGGVECFIEFEATAGGAVNLKYQAAVEQCVVAAQVAERRVAKIEDDAEHVKANRAAVKSFALARMGAIYDACVIGWRSNIQDGGKDIDPTREKFLELADTPISAISTAISKFADAVMDAGIDADQVTQEIVKN